MALIAMGAPSLVLSRRNCAPRYVLLSRNVVAAIFSAMVALLLVRSRPFPMIFSPLMRLSGHSRSQETKWCSVSHLLISHPASLMTVVAVMTSMPSIRVRSAGHAKQAFAQIKLRLICVLPLLDLFLPLLFRYRGTVAAFHAMLQIL